MSFHLIVWVLLLLFADDRFKKPGNIQYMSKWLRKSIRPCESYRESLEGLKAFFKGFEVNFTVLSPFGIFVHICDI